MMDPRHFVVTALTLLACRAWGGANNATALRQFGNVAYGVGWKLRFDRSRRQLVDDAEADQMLTREYRVPCVGSKEVQ